MPEETINFNFIDDEDTEEEIATGGNPEPEVAVEPEIATGGNFESVHQGLTKEQILDAQRQAESPRGLDMAAFIKSTGLPNLDFEQLLRYKVT